MAEQEYAHLFKVLMVGSSGVGKTSIVMKYTEDIYKDTYRSTIGVDFRLKTISVDGETVKLQLWDTAGQERFRSITASYYRNANGIVLVFDITDAETFKDLRIWLEEISNNINSPVVILILGNKIDAVGTHPEQVCSEDVEALISAYTAKNTNLNIKGYRKVSAKTSEGISECFEEVSRGMKQELAHTGASAHKGIQLETDESVSGWCCIG
ncbi:Ras-related protein Rab-1A [Nematocida sp. AWRm77]|nr:Ras-related protein Rab-1A [Nematocida sp. AWRm77]